jgi:predicted amidohydrolase
MVEEEGRRLRNGRLFQLRLPFMRVGVFQFSPEFGQVTENLKRIDDSTEGIDADLLVLPELCTTGYQFTSRDEAFGCAETVPGGATCEKLGEIAGRRGLSIVAGMVEGDGERLYNSAVYFGPEGYRGKYRKIHLFNEEKFVFDPGMETFPLFPLGEARLGMMVCFDWIFPESARTLALKGADIICLPANLVLPFCQAAMVARSIENGVFIVVANRVGEEERGGKAKLEFTGRSQVTSNRGEIILKLDREEERVAMVEIEPLEARDKKITENNHLLNDRRRDLYSL